MFREKKATNVQIVKDSAELKRYEGFESCSFNKQEAFCDWCIRVRSADANCTQHMEQDWLHYVDHLLRVWTGYQLAVRMLSGGPETHEKAKWFAEVLAERVSNSQNLEVHSLSEWIADILDNEFDLILEDNSIEWVASSLIKCSTWLNKGQKVELENFLSQLPSESAIQTAATESQAVLDNSDQESSDCEELEHGAQEQQIKRPSRRRMETGEDGWTTVTRR